jgi:hypothetical protein
MEMRAPYKLNCCPWITQRKLTWPTSSSIWDVAEATPTVSLGLFALIDLLDNHQSLDIIYRNFYDVLATWISSIHDPAFFDSLVDKTIPLLDQLLYLLSFLCSGASITPDQPLPEWVVSLFLRFFMIIIELFPSQTFRMLLVCSSLQSLIAISNFVFPRFILPILEIDGFHNSFQKDQHPPLFSISSLNPTLTQFYELAIAIVQLFSSFLDSLNPRNQFHIVLNRLLSLAVSPCCDLSFSALSALIEAARRYPKSFVRYFRSSRSIHRFIEQFRFFHQNGDPKGVELMLSFFAEMTQCNVEADNLYFLGICDHFLPLLLELLAWNFDIVFFPCCRILTHLIISCKGLVAQQIVENLTNELLPRFDEDMDAQSKLAAGILFAHSVLKAKSQRLVTFLNYQAVIDNLQVFLEIGNDKEIKILLQCLLRLLAHPETSQEIRIGETLYDVLENLPNRVADVDFYVDRILILMKDDG